MNIHCPVNNVIVKVSAFSDDRKGIFYVDPRIEELWHRRQYGEVIAIPDYVDKSLYGFENIEEKVKVGDTIYFDYTIVNRDRGIMVNGSEVFFCPYYCIYCIMRGDGCYDMIGDNVLIEPVKYYRGERDGYVYIPESVKVGEFKNRGIVRSGWEDMTGKKVYFPSWAANKNVVDEKEYFIIPKRNIFAYE